MKGWRKMILARFPLRWNHLSGKKSRQINNPYSPDDIVICCNFAAIQI